MIRPILEYGACIITRSPKQLQDLERFQLKALKSLLGLPANTKSAAVRLFTATPPIASRFKFLRLKYFMKLKMMDRDRIISRVFRHRFIHMEEGFCARVREDLSSHMLIHDFAINRDVEPAKFCNRIRNAIFRAAYVDDLRVLAASDKAARFYRALQPSGSYTEAKPHPMCDTFGTANRECRIDFFKAIFGTHPLCTPAGLNNPAPLKCRHCGCDYGTSRPLTHTLFHCPVWHAERLAWSRNIILIIAETKHHSDSFLIKLFNSAVQPPYTPSSLIELVSFGGELPPRVVRGFEDRVKERDHDLIKERKMLITLQTAQLITVISQNILEGS